MAAVRDDSFTAFKQSGSSDEHKRGAGKKAPGDSDLFKAYGCFHGKAQHYAVGRGAEPAGL